MRISSKWIALLAVSALSLVALTNNLRPVMVVQAPTTQEKVDKVAVSAVTLTPIASLSQSSSNCPEALGGSCNVAGGLYADTVRIDIYARTGSSTATLNLIEYYRDDSRWVIHGSDCTVTTALTLCRYITKRGNRHWHVYKSAGTTAYVAIDEVSGPSAGLGSIEPGAGGGSGPALSDATPSALGVAASGSSGDASRADHVHAMPSASDITTGTFDNARINWASPSALGSSTPAAVTGTTVTGNTSVLAPLLDAVSAGALNIGTTTATSIVLRQSTSLSTGKTFTVGSNVLITSDQLAADKLLIASQAVGDLLYASSTTAWARLPDVATGQVLTSGGVGVAPAYSATPSVTTLTGSTSLLTPLLDSPSAGTLALGTTTATAITLAQTTTLAANKSLLMAAGTGGLSLGSGTGDTSMPTGSWNYAGASGKSISFIVNSNSRLTISSTAATLYGTSTTQIGTNNSTTTVSGGNGITVQSGVSSNLTVYSGLSLNLYSSYGGNIVLNTGQASTVGDIYFQIGGTTSLRVSGTSGEVFVSANEGFGFEAGTGYFFGSNATGTWSMPQGAGTILSARVNLTQNAVSGGTANGYIYTGGAHTALTASTEKPDWNWNGTRTVQFATGALTTQRQYLFQPATYAFVGASTLTNAATVAISGAPAAGTNATITNAYALWVQAGTSRFDGAVSLGSTISGDGSGLTGIVSGVFTAGAEGALAAGTTRYLNAVGVTWSAGENPVFIATKAMTIRNLYCYMGTAPGGGGAGTLVSTVRKNGSDQATACTITDPGTSCNNVSDTFTVVAGDRVSMKGVTNASANNGAGLTCTFSAS